MLPPDQDAAIRSTDSDASQARLSAVHAGYLEDHFARYFGPKIASQPRPPLINVGTWLRTVAIDRLVDDWLRHFPGAQILSLGAGSDTRFWRIATGALAQNLSKYVELDFAQITTKKAMTIRKTPPLNSLLPSSQLTGGGTGLTSPTYTLLPADLRQPLPFSAMHLDPSKPTLVLCECILVYLPPPASLALLSSIFAHLTGPVAVVAYEMFALDDAFGRVMRANLQSRGVALPGVLSDAHALMQRFVDAGADHDAARVVTLRDVWTAEEAKRVQHGTPRKEMLDEVEELELVLAHYAVAWGARGAKPWGLSD